VIFSVETCAFVLGDASFEVPEFTPAIDESGVNDGQERSEMLLRLQVTLDLQSQLPERGTIRHALSVFPARRSALSRIAHPRGVRATR
jgi:hypothetical protein